MDNARLDFLQELGNIGAGHAATALSQMLNWKPLKLVVPEAVILPFEEAFDFVGGPEQQVVGIYIRVSEDISGHMAFLLPMNSARNLVEQLVGEDSEELSELALSALAEVGNIMVTSYLNALSDLTSMTVAPSVPAIATDMAGAIWQSILADANAVDSVTLIKTQFATDQVAIDGHIIFLPNEDDFVRIAKVLGLEEL